MKANARMSPTINPAARPAFEKKLLALPDVPLVADGLAVGVVTMVVPPTVTVTPGVEVVLRVLGEVAAADSAYTNHISKPEGG